MRGTTAILTMLALPSLAQAADVRVATWNVETVGTPGSAEYEAAVDVLAVGSLVDSATVLLRQGVHTVEGAGATKAARPSDVPDGVVEVTADTDGTFYARPEPSAPSFVEAGATVKPATTLGLVEVMKTFTPVKAPVAGTVEKVLVGDGEAVEAGQTLVWIRVG